MLAEAIEVYRSPTRAPCAERAFVLTAVGVPHEMAQSPDGFSLWVDPAAPGRGPQPAVALPTREPPAAARPRPGRAPALWLRMGGQCGIRPAVLVAVAVAISAGDWGAWMPSPPANSTPGWCDRASGGGPGTALTLHLDSADIPPPTSARGPGSAIWPAGCSGPGTAWALVVFGAGLANGIEALLAPADHTAVGASTAVFTASACWPRIRGASATWSRCDRRSATAHCSPASSCWAGWAPPAPTRMSWRTCWASPSAASRRRGSRPTRAAPVAAAASVGGRRACAGHGGNRLGLRVADQLDVPAGAHRRGAAPPGHLDRAFPVPRLRCQFLVGEQRR